MAERISIGSVNARQAARIGCVLLAVAVAGLTLTAVVESRSDRSTTLKQNMQQRIQNLSVEPPARTDQHDERDIRKLARQISIGKRLWGPLIKPPPPPPPPEVSLAKLAQGLSIVAILGDINGDEPVRFLVKDSGSRAIVSKGDPLRQFVVKDYTNEGLILQYEDKTHTLPFPGN